MLRYRATCLTAAEKQCWLAAASGSREAAASGAAPITAGSTPDMHCRCHCLCYAAAVLPLPVQCCSPAHLLRVLLAVDQRHHHAVCTEVQRLLDAIPAGAGGTAHALIQHRQQTFCMRDTCCRACDAGAVATPPAVKKVLLFVTTPVIGATHAHDALGWVGGCAAQHGVERLIAHLQGEGAHSSAALKLGVCIEDRVTLLCGTACL